MANVNQPILDQPGAPPVEVPGAPTTYFANLFQGTTGAPAVDPRDAQIANVMRQSADNVQGHINAGAQLVAQAQAKAAEANGTAPQGPQMQPDTSAVPEGLDPTLAQSGNPKDAVQDLGQQQLTREATDHVNGPTTPDVSAQNVQTLAGQYHAPQTQGAALAGAANNLADQEPDPRRANLITLDRDQMNSDRVQNLVHAVQLSRAATAQNKREDAADVINTANWIRGGVTKDPSSLLNAAIWAAKNTTEFLEEMVVPGFKQLMSNVLAKHLPDFDQARYMAGLGPKNSGYASYEAELREQALQMPPMRATAMMQDILADVGQKRLLLNDDSYVRNRMIDTIFGPYENAMMDPHTASKAALKQDWEDPNLSVIHKVGKVAMDSLATVLTQPQVAATVELSQYLGIGSLGKDIAYTPYRMAVQRALTRAPLDAFLKVQMSPTSPAAGISNSVAGATKLVTALGSTDSTTALHAFGTTPGETAGTLILPKVAMQPVTSTISGAGIDIDLSAAKLPTALAGAKPKMAGTQLTFANDVDRALYIVAQSKKSAADNKYVQWLKDQGLTDDQIKTRAADMRNHVVQSTNNEGNPGEFAVPARNTDTITTPGQPQTRTTFVPRKASNVTVESPEDIGVEPGEQAPEPAKTVDTGLPEIGTVNIDNTKPIPLLGGSNGKGTIYTNRGWNPVKRIGGQLIDRTKYLAIHEAKEAHNEQQLGWNYTDSHNDATTFEHAAWSADHPDIPFSEYQKSYDGELAQAAQDTGKPPADLIEKPYDHPHNVAQRRELAEVKSGERTAPSEESPQVETSPYPQADGKPMIEQGYLDPAEVARQKAKGLEGNKSLFTNRLNDAHVMADRDTQTFSILNRLGNGHGVGFTTQDEAAKWADGRFSGQYSIAQDATGGWNVEYVTQHPYSIPGKEGVLSEAPVKVKVTVTLPGGGIGWARTESTNPIKNFLGRFLGFRVGKSAIYSDTYARGSSIAYGITTKAQRELRAVARPFFKLQGSSQKFIVNTFGKLEKEFQDDPMNAAARFDPKIHGDRFDMSTAEREGASAFQDVTERMRGIGDDNATAELNRRHFVEANINGKPQFVRSEEHFEPGVREKVRANARTVYDLMTGQRVNLNDMKPSEYKLWQVYGDEQGVAAITRGNYEPAAKPITNALKNRPFWQPRQYTDPYFVKRLDADGTWHAYKTAEGPKAADQEAASSMAQNPGTTYQTFRASKLSDQSGTFTELDTLREQGLLRTSDRLPEALTDVHGNTHMMDGANALDNAIRSASMQQGLARWGMVQKSIWDNLYGKKFGISLDLAHEPTGTTEMKATQEFSDARMLYDNIRMVMGMHEGQGWWVRNFRNGAADMFYNISTGVKSLPVIGKPGAAVSKWFGDHISGMKATTGAAMKNFAYIARIALNPTVHLPMQASNIMTYAGVNGGAWYMASGKMTRDLLYLMVRKSNMATDFMKMSGMPRDYADLLDKHWGASAMNDVADNHLMLADLWHKSKQMNGSAGDALGSAMQLPIKLLSAVGFEAGMKLDNMAAWLTVRNRALKAGEDLANPNVMQKVLADAMELGGGLNRTDQLVDSQAEAGVLSRMFQMRGFGLKYQQRLQQVFGVGGSTTGFSAGEMRRMALVSLGMWGVRGYGLEQLGQYVINKYFPQIPDEVKDAIKGGMVGTMVNHILREWDDPNARDANGQKVTTDINISEQYSPYYATGDIVEGVHRIALGMINMRMDQLEDLVTPSSVSFGAATKLFKAVDAMRHICFDTDLPATDKIIESAQAFFKQFPEYDEVLKARLAYKYGVLIDNSGGLVTKATKGDILGSLIGATESREQGVNDLNKFMYGSSEGTDFPGQTAENPKIKDWASHTWGWLAPVLRDLSPDTPDMDIDTATQLLHDHNIAFKAGMSEMEFNYYQTYLKEHVDKAGLFKDQKIARALMKRLQKPGEPPIDASFADRLDHFDYPEKDDVNDMIKRMYEPYTPITDEEKARLQ